MDSTPPESAPHRPLTFLAAAGWTLLAAILLGIAIASIDGVHPGALTDVVTIAGCKAAVYAIVLFGMLRVHEPEASIRRILAFRRPPILMVLFSLAAGAALAPPSMWLNGLLAKRYPPSPEETEALDHIFAADGAGRKLGVVLALVVVIPIADELFFRGALFTPLKKGRRAEIVVLATAAYDTLLAGLSPHQAISGLVIALVFSWMRAASGSIWPSMGARVAFFAVEVVPPIVFHRDDEPGLRLVLASVAALVVSLAGMAWVARRSELARDARIQDG